MTRLLIHSHDLNLQFSLAPALGEGYAIQLERRIDKVRELLSQKKCDVLLLELDSRSYTLAQQLQFCDELRDLGTPAVVLVEEAGTASAMDLAQRGLFNYVRKPAATAEVAILVRRAYEFDCMKKKMEAVVSTSPAVDRDRLIGASPCMRAVHDLIRRVADPEAPVLITGESGTGKELIARSIHAMGIRRSRPFVAVSCGAIPESLIEAELFGVEKGAYTGAATRRKGYLEEAGNGTLFLDEIGELSAHTQVRLLRVLQEKEFNRLGSSQLIPLQARLLFATHRTLLEMVEEGTFRRDLYYRVNVVEIKSPPLRDHAGDIAELVRHFLAKYSGRYKRPVPDISLEAMALLGDYEWPGNVRELENVIQSAILMNDGGTIRPMDLPEALREETNLCGTDSPLGDSFEAQLQDYKIKVAQRAIQDCKGNKTLAARSLSISRTYLHRLIRNPLEAVDSYPATTLH